MEIQRRKKYNQKNPEKRFWWNVNEQARADHDKHEKWFKNSPMGVHFIAKLFTGALSRAGVDCTEKKLRRAPKWRSYYERRIPVHD